MLKSFLIFKRTNAHLLGKKDFILFLKKIVHSQGLNVLNMPKHFSFMSIFKHIKFAIIWKIF
jgi:hypothetical protein